MSTIGYQPTYWYGAAVAMGAGDAGYSIFELRGTAGIVVRVRKLILSGLVTGGYFTIEKRDTVYAGTGITAVAKAQETMAAKSAVLRSGSAVKAGNSLGIYGVIMSSIATNMGSTIIEFGADWAACPTLVGTSEVFSVQYSAASSTPTYLVEWTESDA